MAQVYELEPTPVVTIMHEDEIKSVEPVYCKIAAVPKYLGVSRSTALRLIQDAEDTEEFNDIVVSLSPTLKLVRLKVLDKFIAARHKKWM